MRHFSDTGDYDERILKINNEENEKLQAKLDKERMEYIKQLIEEEGIPNEDL
jgi:hypothetical protein